jgi:hypothetical protein
LNPDEAREIWLMVNLKWLGFTVKTASGLTDFVERQKKGVRPR